ncbi:glycosyltransferase [Flammeovirga pectinis]|uniref:Glycosyltransferase n=1 Tax=Flammeovirga pectinis TaxID=2494373 RepID=A0A3Q9FIP4_9BACT|nr:glycosyltransferase [Flammeovirga pectinis]AZQ60722.1 glycosyltransferase [Flammeovirga pectinis]
MYFSTTDFLTLLYFLFCIPQLLFWGIIVPLNLWKKQTKVESFKKPVSVIIAARNEENSLPKLLEVLVNQDYHNFEIIVVNDRSSDNTERIIDSYTLKYSFIKKVNIDKPIENHSPKKYALTKGILFSKNEYLLFTDADCFPSSTSWIREMSNQFISSDLILGVGLYTCNDKSKVEVFTQFETLHTALLYTSLSNLGINYMGVGRNIAYTKQLWKSVNGFEQHKTILSGDDDLFVNQIAKKEHTISYFSKKAITYSKPPITWKEWFRQKTRHLSAGYHYKISNKLILGTLSTSHIAVYFIYLLLLPHEVTNLLHLSILFLVRIMFLIICFKKFSAVLGEKFKWWKVPILDIMLIAYQIIIGVSSVISKRKTWI